MAGFAQTARRKIPAMTRVFSSIGDTVAAADWVRAASVAGITAVILFLVLTAIGFALLFARRRSSADQRLPALQRQANILLVRVDDAIRSSEDELGFAIAQFGEEKTREFSAAIDGCETPAGRGVRPPAPVG